jgi:hypothetical protein
MHTINSYWKKDGVFCDEQRMSAQTENRPRLLLHRIGTESTKDTSSSHDTFKVLPANNRAASTGGFFDHIS